MKAKILSYAGPHKAVVDGGKQLLSVRLAYNHPHPAIGEEIEFDAKQVVSKSDKPEPAKEEKEPKK